VKALVATLLFCLQMLLFASPIQSTQSESEASRSAAKSATSSAGNPDSQKPRTNPAKRKGGPKAPAPQEQFGHYWTLEPGWESVLELRNLRPENLKVTPVLRTAEGVEIPLPEVSLGPDEVQTIDLLTQVRSLAPQLLTKANAYGSLVLKFTSVDRLTLYAAMMVRQPGSPISFHVDTALYPGNIARGSRESIWWLSRPELDADLIVTNFSAHPKPARLVLSDSAGKTAETRIALGPRQTYRTKLRYLVQKAKFKSEFGGLQLIPDDQDDSALQLTHFLYDATTGFSAHMKVLSRGSGFAVGPQTTRAPMMALSQPDPALGFPAETVLRPVVFVRNITAKPISAKLALNWFAGEKAGVATTEIAELGAGETRLVEISQFQARGDIPKDAHWATVSLSYTGHRGDIIPIAASYEAGGRYGVQTPFSQSVSYAFKGGMWHVSPIHNTLLTAGNGGTKNATVSFRLRFDGGKRLYELPDRELAPGEQMWVDVGKLVRNQVPDKNGVAMPIDLEHGSYEFSDVHNPVLGYLYEGKLVIDKTYGHATYGCSCCCPRYNTWMDPWYGFLPGQTGQAGVFTEGVCTGGTINVTQAVSWWWTGNSGVGTVSGSGLESAAAAGETSVSSVLYYTGPMPEAGNCECGELQAYPESGMTVDAIPSVALAMDKGVVKDQNGTLDLIVSYPSGYQGNIRPLTLQIDTTSGSGSAVFANNNGSSLQTSQTGSFSVSIKGTATSSTADNIRVRAIFEGNTLASKTFSVIFVTITMQTSGSIPIENGARDAYINHPTNPSRTANLGQFSPAYIGVQFTGTISPTNFAPESPSSFEFKRSILKSRVYEDAANGSTLVHCINDSGLSITCEPRSAGSDTVPQFQDVDPSNGLIYDLDGPGPDQPGVGNTRRLRVNFEEWVEYRGVRASATFAWFSRSSRKRTSTSEVYETSFGSDNQAGIGTTALTWNLQ